MKRLIISDVHLGAPYFDKKYKLMNLLSKDFDEIIVVGDFYELLGFKSLDQIKKEDSDLMTIIDNKNIIFIKGNHDLESCHLDNFMFELPNGKKVILVHGHQFDGTEDKGFWTKVNIILYKIFKIEVRRYLRTLKDYSKLYAKALAYYKEKCDYLILGHTHEPFVDTENNIYNCGDWLEHCSWIEIIDDEIILKQEK